MKRYLLVMACAIVMLGTGSNLWVSRAAAHALPATGDAPLWAFASQGGVDPPAVFAKLCAACHGDKGEGGYGPTLTQLKDQNDAGLADVIVHGKGKMPAVGAGSSSAEVEALVRFIKAGFVVSPPAGVQAVQRAPAVLPVLPANLSLNLSPEAGGRVVARVKLRSSEGVPIRGAAIDLYRLTTMGGKLGVAELYSDGSGEATQPLNAVGGQLLKVEAAYAGSSDWGPVQTQASIDVQVGTNAAGSLIAPLTSRSSPPALVTVFALVFGAVWVTYGSVAYRLLQIARRAKET